MDDEDKYLTTSQIMIVSIVIGAFIWYIGYCILVDYFL